MYNIKLSFTARRSPYEKVDFVNFVLAFPSSLLACFFILAKNSIHIAVGYCWTHVTCIVSAWCDGSLIALLCSFIIALFCEQLYTISVFLHSAMVVVYSPNL